MDKAHRGGGESVGDVEIGNAVQGHGNMSGGYKVNAFALMVDDEHAAIRSWLPHDGDAACLDMSAQRFRHAVAAMEREPDERAPRSEEHTSELQSLMRISYAVFC